jgi:hypothetical protein
MKLVIPDSYWEPMSPESGDDRLLCREPLEINGLSMHVEAWRVEMTAGENSTQAHLYDDDDFQQMWRVFSNGDGDFQTTQIRGKEYVIFATPFVD